MPIGEIAGEIAGGVVRLLWQFLAEVVVEIFVRGVGYAIWRRASPSTDPDHWPSLVVGLLFWGAMSAIGYFAYEHASEWLAVDRCLDSGGSYNYQSGACVHA